MTEKRVSGTIKRIEMKNMDKSGKNPRFSIQFFIQYDVITPPPQHPVSAYILNVQTGALERLIQGWIRLSFQSKVPLAELPPKAQETYQDQKSWMCLLEQYAEYRVEDYLVVDIVKDILIVDVVQHQAKGD